MASHMGFKLIQPIEGPGAGCADLEAILPVGEKLGKDVELENTPGAGTLHGFLPNPVHKADVGFKVSIISNTRGAKTF